MSAFSEVPSRIRLQVTLHGVRGARLFSGSDVSTIVCEREARLDSMPTVITVAGIYNQ